MLHHSVSIVILSVVSSNYIEPVLQEGNMLHHFLQREGVDFALPTDSTTYHVILSIFELLHMSISHQSCKLPDRNP
jgi:hypothetical protein